MRHKKRFLLSAPTACALIHITRLQVQPTHTKETEMAHFVKLTQASLNGYTEEDTQVLFNLDTVISVEPVGDKSVIQTRWGRVTVREDLDSILDQAHADQAGVSAPQLDSINRINEESLSL